MYYINKYIGNMELIGKPVEADYIIMTNRASFKVDDKQTCFNKYRGKNIVEVKRLKLVLSKMVKIN